MAESDVAVAPTEISPVDNETLDATAPTETAPVVAESERTEAEMEEKEVEEAKGGDEAQVATEGAVAGEEIGKENQDLKRKLEVQEDVERELEGAGDNGEDRNEGEEEREGSEAKRQKTEITETEEAQKSGEALEEEPPLPENGENREDNNNDGLGQTAEGDVKKDDLDADETERIDDPSETSRTIEVPNHRVGVLIGKAGDTIRNMQKLSGARIQIVKDSETAPDATTRAVEILGSIESIDKAEELIRDVLAEADAGRPPPLSGRAYNMSQSSQVEMQVPTDKVGSIIGKGGQMIKDLQARSGAHILLVQPQDSEGEDAKERTVRLSGSKQQIEAAKYMIKDIINQTGRPHSQNRGGPGPRQTYGSRGPASYGHGSQKQWGPPRQQHQSSSTGFSKYPNQRGKNYPQHFPQSSRQSYGKYPPSRTSGRGGSMGPSWDQRAPFPGNQPPAQYGASGGFQYGQQQPPQGYGAPNPYPQNAQQSYQAPPAQQYYGQQPTQPGYQQQTYNAMYSQGQAAGASYGANATAQPQNPYAMGQYGQAYSQPTGADGYAQQYPQQYPQQPGQVAPGYSQAAPAYNQSMGVQANMNYGYADPSAGYNAAASQAGYGQAGYVQEQPATQVGFDQGTAQPAAAGATAQASAAPASGGQWQG
ncbi:Far upstream element-binding protein 3 [Rhynchospora pubera]|uniref:Far upstream element-binding protein 3 n=1 Tax=Rhynchospora pubera TaxID=906938 RepID=A0AAV8G670_9POAL|nr:Far upstream element-binding protein 3 [Rhynchospora pubera]